MWEGTWVQFLLGRNFHPVPSDRVADLLDPNNQFVYIGSSAEVCAAADYFIRSGVNFGAIVLSDELLRDECQYIKYENCRFVMRNYVHPTLINEKKVSFFGLGYKTNFCKYLNHNSHLEREFIWNFIGTPHHVDRQQALETFKAIDGHFIHLTEGFGSADSLHISRYAEIINNSLYTLCPYGHYNADTFRVYEALEAGSVPIVPRNAPGLDFPVSYWSWLFRGEVPPFVMASDWNEAREIVMDDLGSGRYIERMELCQLFWRKWKLQWRYDLLSNLDALIHIH
jgi:hypothetical protein